MTADAQADLRLCCSHMAKTGFLMTEYIFYILIFLTHPDVHFGHFDWLKKEVLHIK